MIQRPTAPSAQAERTGHAWIEREGGAHAAATADLVATLDFVTATPTAPDAHAMGEGALADLCAQPPTP